MSRIKTLIEAYERAGDIDLIVTENRKVATYFSYKDVMELLRTDRDLRNIIALRLLFKKQEQKEKSLIHLHKEQKEEIEKYNRFIEYLKKEV